MKRLNPNTQKPFKRNEIREDGYIFAQYSKKIKLDGYFSEVWKSPQSIKKAYKFNACWKRFHPEIRSKTEALRRAQKLKATPPWLTFKQKFEITLIYKQCFEITKQTGVKHHVDHIIPLKGKMVSGLHVPWNLQILSQKENCSKGNKF